MIENLVLHNFQTHKHSNFPLSTGVNVITGESDQGKSSVIRALYWLFRNRPSGDEFIRWGQNSCSVQAAVQGKTIKRERGKNKNKYVIDGRELNAVRNEVPETLGEIINITPTNIQLQDEWYFLLNSSPSDVARALNQVAGLDQIDNSLRHVNMLVRQATTTINHIHKDIKAKEEKLRKYENLNEIDALHERHKKLTSNLHKIQQRKDKLIDVIENLEEHAHVLEYKQRIENLDAQIDQLEEKRTELSQLAQSRSVLARIIQSIDHHAQIIQSIQPAIQELDRQLKEVRSKYEQRAETNQFLKELSKTIESIESCQKRYSKARSEYNKYHEEFENLKTELEVCPFCESALN